MNYDIETLWSVELIISQSTDEYSKSLRKFKSLKL